jgi:hypothetical protein
VHMVYHILTIRTKPWGFIKSSVQNKVVHMQLSLLLSFYMKRRLGSYMVSTTTGFPVEIVEALAPQPHR